MKPKELMVRGPLKADGVLGLDLSPPALQLVRGLLYTSPLSDLELISLAGLGRKAGLELISELRSKGYLSPVGDFYWRLNPNLSIQG